MDSIEFTTGRYTISPREISVLEKLNGLPQTNDHFHSIDLLPTFAHRTIAERILNSFEDKLTPTPRRDENGEYVSRLKFIYDVAGKYIDSLKGPNVSYKQFADQFIELHRAVVNNNIEVIKQVADGMTLSDEGIWNFYDMLSQDKIQLRTRIMYCINKSKEKGDPISASDRVRMWARFEASNARYQNNPIISISHEMGVLRRLRTNLSKKDIKKFDKAFEKARLFNRLARWLE